jgi:predicted enzyme related to lactoylglutathione lyase
MESKGVIRGMANVSYWAEDVKAARNWYNQVFGLEPYFQRPDADNPAYIEYRVGDYQHEVGIINKNYRPKTENQGAGGAILYWHVDHIEAALERLLALGAKEIQPITKWGEGFVTAAVLDPFGNIFGVMYNQHYLDTLAGKNK